jgi:LDH2 family malate/lactate/ureidoglycolate dehydrogenase
VPSWERCAAHDHAREEGIVAQEETRIGWEALQAFTRDIFVSAGLPRAAAEIEAEVLVWANLRGVDSHGVLRIPWYLELMAAGAMNPHPRIQVVKETPATLLIDADRAFGPVVTTSAMKQVIEKARAVGIGWALLRNVTHQGAMAYYTLMAAQEGLAGIAVVCSPPNMAPYGARAAGVHNSPISIAVPGRRHPPLVLDMATSIAAGGKLRLAIDQDAAIPTGWALDKDGHPTTDPRVATILMPAGGPKGSGLAMMFECLTSLMVGNPLVVPALTAPDPNRPHAQNGLVAAIDISTFTDGDAYREQIDQLIDAIKALPRAEGAAEIFVPGEPEQRVHADRLRHGIPLPAGTVQNLRRVAEQLGVALPAGLTAR